MTTTQGTEPTQVRHSARATVRTILQVGIPAMLALPLIIDVIVAELGGQLPPGVTAWLVAAGAFITAIAAVITKIMALPQVELLLRRLPDWTLLAAQPRPKPDEPQPILGKAFTGGTFSTAEDDARRRGDEHGHGGLSYIVLIAVVVVVIFALLGIIR